MEVVYLGLQEGVSAEVGGLAQKYVKGGEGSVGATGPCCTISICLNGEWLWEGFVGWEGGSREVEL